MKINEISKKIKIGMHPSNEPEDKIVQFIKKNCSQIVKVYENSHSNFLFSGKESYSDVFFGKPINNRAPLGTDRKINNKLNSVLRQVGFKARRDNSIFTTSMEVTAQEYGKVYIIFPLNGFDYSWCALAEDLTMEFDIGEKKYSVSRENNEFYNDLITLLPQEFVQKYHFKNNEGFEYALTNGFEILIHGSYVAISEESSLLEIILPFYRFNEDNDLEESASCGSTSSGSIATVNGTNTPPSGQFFGGDPNSSVYGKIKRNRRRRKNATPRV